MCEWELDPLFTKLTDKSTSALLACSEHRGAGLSSPPLRVAGAKMLMQHKWASGMLGSGQLFTPIGGRGEIQTSS